MTFASFGRIQNLHSLNRCASHNSWAFALKKEPIRVEPGDTIACVGARAAQHLHILLKCIAIDPGDFKQPATFFAEQMRKLRWQVDHVAQLLVNSIATQWRLLSAACWMPLPAESNQRVPPLSPVRLNCDVLQT